MLNFSTFCKRKMYFRMLTNTILFQYRKLNTYFYHWWWIIRHRVWSILSSSADLSGWRNHIWWGLVCDIRHRDYIRRNRSHRGWKKSVIWTNCFGCNSHVARYLLSSLYVVCGVGCTCLSTCSLCVFYHQIGSASFARLGLVRKRNYCFFCSFFVTYDRTWLFTSGKYECFHSGCVSQATGWPYEFLLHGAWTKRDSW